MSALCRACHPCECLVRAQDNAVRQPLIQLVLRPEFDAVVLVAIVLNALALAVRSPHPSPLHLHLHLSLNLRIFTVSHPTIRRWCALNALALAVSDPTCLY